MKMDKELLTATGSIKRVEGYDIEDKEGQCHEDLFGGTRICDEEDTIETLIKAPSGLGLFQLYDVAGDGNCFFASCSKCPYITINDPSILRSEMVKFLQNNDEALKLFTDVVHEQSMTFKKWVSEIQRNGTWGGATTTMFICLMFHVNICIISNGENGFLSNDIRSWEGIDFLSEDAPTMFLYHHYSLQATIPKEQDL